MKSRPVCHTFLMETCTSLTRPSRRGMTSLPIVATALLAVGLLGLTGNATSVAHANGPNTPTLVKDINPGSTGYLGTG